MIYLTIEYKKVPSLSCSFTYKLNNLEIIGYNILFIIVYSFKIQTLTKSLQFTKVVYS